MAASKLATSQPTDLGRVLNVMTDDVINGDELIDDEN